MLSEEMKDNIRRHYGSTDEDLADLAAVMDALKDMDRVDELQRQLETSKLESDQALKQLDETWRNRYRERFFDGDVTTPDLIDPTVDDNPDPEDISIEEYLESFKEKK